MPDKTSTSETQRTVPIDEEIYQDIREYCESNGLKFINFIQDAFDNAIKREEILRISAETLSAKKEIEKIQRSLHRERERSYGKGFSRGFYYAFMMFQGFDVELNADEIEALKRFFPPGNSDIFQDEPPIQYELFESKDKENDPNNDNDSSK